VEAEPTQPSSVRRGTAGESAKIRIGNKAHKNTYIAGISGVTVAGGVGVIIDTTGHLGTLTSSARYKEAIHPMNASSEAILVAPDEAGNPYTIRYEAVNAMLLNEFLKEHRKDRAVAEWRQLSQRRKY